MKYFTPPHAKAVIGALALLILTSNLLAQNGQKWATGGNSLSGGEVLGSKNNYPLNFIVNNNQELAILTNGTVQAQSLTTGTPGIVTYDATGVLKPLNFSGNVGDVLSGNGTWVAGNSFSQWITNGNNIYYNTGNVGIGIANPTSPLTVSGNIVSTGNIYGQSIAASQSLSVGTVIVTSTGNVDTLRSTAGLQVNATTVNAGTINTQKFNADSLKALAITTKRILPYPGDSVIYIGDDAFSWHTSGIWKSSINFVPTENQGIGLNRFQNSQPGWSCAVGRNNVITNTQSITIGNFLTNRITNCIMLGINNPALLIDQNNNVGIGTTTPQQLVDIWGANGGPTTVRLFSTSQSTASTLWTANGSFGYGFGIDANNNGAIYANYNSPVEAMTIMSNGNGGYYFGIGTTNPGFPLDVTGTIRAYEVRVCLNQSCDFVFDKDYKLMKPSELRDYLNINRHLPGIASAKEMEEEGTIDLGKMNSQLLQKTEESVLYILNLYEENEELKRENETLKTKMVDMQGEIDEIKAEVRNK